ncbi:MAG TPA: DEAD/DEAH box helicase [Polyangiaceae bacterium]|nr:DEAD/DEAH box helicase [Polyangiaceae bacterium]
MTAAPLQDRFSLLSAGLSSRQWRLLGAIALEQGLSRGVLLALSGEGADAKVLDAWLNRAVASGLVVPVGPTRTLSLTQAPHRESGYAPSPELGQLVLRSLAQRGSLPEIARVTHDLLGARSVGDLALALVSGDYTTFTKRFSAERLPRQIALRSREAWLRAAICEPFDATWLKKTWGEQAHAIALQVLREALDQPSACGALQAWLAQRFEQLLEPEQRAELASLLCEHALLRGRPELVSDYVRHVGRVSALGYAAAAALSLGDLALAQARLDQALGMPVRGGSETGARRVLPQCGAVAPLLGLLLCARGSEAAASQAKRLLSVGTRDAERAAGRAFRALLRHLGQAESERDRIDVHDLSSAAPAWETLLCAYDVQLHQTRPETRARWAQHLVRRVLDWQTAGYDFLAAQALGLARELSPEYAEQELAKHDALASTPAAPALSLWDLVTARPEWQRSLQALATLAERAEQAAEASLRVAWYVDMSDGGLSRPALQEHRAASGGWSQGRRLSLSELYGYLERLPLEDQRVLEATRELSPGRRELMPEAHERLIGHPRVLNGARGGARVDVVAGACRVETVEHAGYVQLVVQPGDASVGVNARPQGEGCLLVFRVSQAMQQVMEVVARGVRVPVAQRAELSQVLGQLSQSIEVHSPELGAEREVEANALPCLRFAPHAGAWLVQAGVRPFGSQGRFFVAGSGRAALSYVEAGARLRCQRDFERERSGVDALVAACPTLSQALEEHEGRAPHEADNWVLGEADVLCLLAELRETSVVHELEWPESGRLRLRGDSRSTLHGRLRVDKGWYLATGGLRIDDIDEVTLAELVHAPALCGGRFVRLENGDYVELEARLRRVIAALAAAAARTKPSPTLRLHGAALAALSELSDEADFELDDAATGWLTRVRRLPASSFEVPASLRAELRPYQLEGFQWLCRLSELGLGACLADDMGLGKTVQILALLLARRAEGPALVVAPTSVCSNWRSEAQRFAPELQVLEYASEDRPACLRRLREAGQGKLLVCSYQLLQQDQAKLGELEFGTAVLDEAQFIKNAQSLRAQAAFRIVAKQRIAATGTPVENHAADLWSIFNFLNPGLLGDFAEFNRRFVRPIDREGGPAPEELLSRLIRPYVLRRLKRDVLSELPPVTELSHEIDLSADEAARYALLRRQIHDKLFTPHGKRDNKLEVLAEITRLRRFCCHPRLVFPDADRDASKVQSFLELVEELRENGHRALVFSQFVDFLDIVREELDERRISYEYLDGSTPRAQRQVRVDAFQNGDASLFLISLKAGGFGLNLTAADYVIHLDPWWNPAVETQATDRAHRIGQQRRVTMYRLITRNSIEQKIVELHASKRKLARSLLDGTAQVASLSSAELLELLQAGSSAGAAHL